MISIFLLFFVEFFSFRFVPFSLLFPSTTRTLVKLTSSPSRSFSQQLGNLQTGGSWLFRCLRPARSQPRRKPCWSWSRACPHPPFNFNFSTLRSGSLARAPPPPHPFPLSHPPYSPLALTIPNLFPVERDRRSGRVTFGFDVSLVGRREEGAFKSVGINNDHDHRRGRWRC